jgi:hypothetical protein
MKSSSIGGAVGLPPQPAENKNTIEIIEIIKNKFNFFITIFLPSCLIK